jgi:ATP-dependent exoDNAse (exonuclease V) beta subunit
MSDIPFTPSQLDAVDISKRRMDACVVAGPGSGKTTVLVEYFRRLVASGVDPLRILAITFTEKAAANMRHKLGRAFKDQPETRARLERAWVSTVHGFCLRILKENAVFAGIDPEFAIADERQSRRFQIESIKGAIDELLAERLEPMRALIRGLSSFEFEQYVLDAYETMRGAGILVDKMASYPMPAGVTVDDIETALDTLRNESISAWSYDQRQELERALEGAERIVAANTTLETLHAVARFECNLNKCRKSNPAYNQLKMMADQIRKELGYWLITEHYAPQRELLIELIRRFDRIYRERKRATSLLDFSDLEEYTVRLLDERPEVRAHLQGQFDHILMDEFQDTNGQQARLMSLLRPPDRFYAVGDINQSIYGFRHAEPEGFRNYRDEIEQRGRHLVELTENFRSRADILAAVEYLTNGLPGIVDRPLVPGRTFDEAPDCSVEVIVAAAPEIEARCIANRIVSSAGVQACAFKDFAVLVRNTEVITGITAAFDAAGIPYVVNRGRGFYESREVNDLTHLLRVIANPRDEISLAVVLRSPLANVSDEEILHLKADKTDLSAGLGDCPPGTRLARFRDLLESWRARREYITFDRLLLAAIDESGYPAAPNIGKFLAQAREAASRMSLDEFVDELSLIRADDPREAEAPPDDSVNAVKIMTIHTAKGLEFPVVFVAGMHKGVDSSAPHVGFSRHTGLGARWRNPVTDEAKIDLYLHALAKEIKQREIDEGNRLLYVAMTRAEKRLVLSFTAANQKAKEWGKTIVDRLLIDLTAAGISEIRPDGTWKVRVEVADAAPELLRAFPTEAVRAEIDYLQAPAVTGQQDTNATVTALARFATCPRQYFLAQYLGYEGRERGLEQAEEDGDLSAGDFGTQVHALLADKPVPKPDPEAVRLADVFRQSPLGRRAARATRIEREFDFLMAVDDLVIRGQIDLWFEEGADLVVVDYKTDDVSAAQAEDRARDYSMQLRLYAMALERVTGRPPTHAFLHFLRPNRVVEVDLTPSLIESPEQVVRDFQEAQAALDFPLVEGDHCRRCQFFKDLCPAPTSGEHRNAMPPAISVGSSG